MTLVRRLALRARAILARRTSENDARGTGWIHALRGDARFAMRYFARRKATTAIIIGVLALATGINTLMFSAFQAQFLRAAPEMPTGGDDPVRVLTAVGKKWRHDRLLVKTRGPAEPYLTDLQRFLRAAAPALPVTSTMTLAQVDAEAYTVTLQMATTAGIGGAAALLLASLGLYGVVSLAVRQRTREIGIRIAVGAHPTRVARSFLASGVRVSLVALAIGLPLSIMGLKLGIGKGFIIAPQVNIYLLGVSIAAILVGVAAAATWVPARRAARVDPVRSLRSE